MRQIIPVALLFFSIAACAQKGFIIEGSITGLEQGTVTLSYRSLSGDDTTLEGVVTNGRFTLKGRVPEPELARFNIKTGWPYSYALFIENSRLQFSLVKGDGSKTQLSGSKSDLLYQRLQPGLNDFFSNARNYDQAHEVALKEQSRYASRLADSVWLAQLNGWTGIIRKAVKAEPGNFAGLYFIEWLLFHPPHYDSLNELYLCLEPSVRNSPSGKAFREKLELYKRLSPGQPAPEVSGNDSSGTAQRLADLRGKVVLLDFWASYCVKCRQTNPELKSVYERYHPAGFDILSVSLDHERSAWVNAIRKDNLSWHHVAELRGGASSAAGLYDVQDLPRNWLIDQHGIILARDLSPEELDERLEQLLAGKK